MENQIKMAWKLILKLGLYELSSKLLISPLITPVMVPYIIPCRTPPCPNFDYGSYSGLWGSRYLQYGFALCLLVIVYTGPEDCWWVGLFGVQFWGAIDEKLTVNMAKMRIHTHRGSRLSVHRGARCPEP